jgi:DNA-binding transcriptional regulator YiaG
VAVAEKRGRGRPPKQPQPATPDQAELARIRRTMGLSVAEFARRMGVRPDTVYRWENGYRQVPAMALKLARFLWATA